MPAPVIAAGRQDEVAEIDATPVEPIAVEPYATGDVQPLADVDPDAALRAAQVPDEPPATPAHARLGSEGVLRLRARYAEVMARISERVQDPARQDELKTQAERLNPDTWVTDAEVGAGLEEYETVFEALRTAVGGPGRGRRHKRRHGAAQQEPEGRQPENAPTEDL